jgi:molybdopterin synthase catalytic subunit
MNTVANDTPIITISLIDGPLGVSCAALPLLGDGACTVGAALKFEGIVRAQEGERVIVALNYEAYRPMADRLLEQLAREVGIKHRLVRVAVEHSVGRVAVGECSFRLTIDSAHRVEALLAMSEFIDRMKIDVPVWKRPVFHNDVDERVSHER